jgi:hypothetical protein
VSRAGCKRAMRDQLEAWPDCADATVTSRG